MPEQPGVMLHVIFKLADSAGNINLLTPRSRNESANLSTSSGVALGQLCASPYTPWA